MAAGGPLSERALILTPFGRDAQIAALVLRDGQHPSFVCRDIDELAREIDRGAGFAVIALEALSGSDLTRLDEVVHEQEPWSDIPFVVLARRGQGPEDRFIPERLSSLLGNVTILERPFHPSTLISVATTSVRSRRRQYEARSHLIERSEGQERLKNALAAGALGSWTLQCGRGMVTPSTTFLAHFCLEDAGELSLERLLDVVHVRDRTSLRERLRGLQGSEPFELQVEIECEGSARWIELRGRRLGTVASPSDQVIGVSSNITARKTEEAERERLLDALAAERSALTSLTRELEQRVDERTSALRDEVAARERAQGQLLHAQKMESLGQLTGGVAHDFNNLLMAIIANLDVLARRFRPEAPEAGLIRAALRGAERGAALTQRMLAFARQQDLTVRSVNVRELIDNARELIRRSIGPTMVLDDSGVAADLPAVEVDSVQFELAILNLAINARDAMPEGGRIELRAGSARLPASASMKAGPYVWIEVADTGSGMSPEILERATEPFYSTKPVGKGTGLGLSMVKGFIEQLGGTLAITSHVGAGTTIRLWLPEAKTAAAAPVVDADIEPQTSRHATILLVDDDELVSSSTKVLLEASGHNVLDVASAEEAIESIEKCREIDLVITDYAMPGMTGLELAAYVKRFRPELPVLLVTGFADLPSASMPNVARLSKPYRQSDMEEQIAALLYKPA